MKKGKKSAKKVAAIIFSLMLICSAGMYSLLTGRTWGAETIIGSSELYSDAEIADAMHTVMRIFRSDFRGCTLEQITYDEDISLLLGQSVSGQYPDADVIVLRTAYTTGMWDGAVPPCTTVQDWDWTLTRSENGKWAVRGCGYA